MYNFKKAFELTVGHEGGYGNDKRDRGNWTTGVIGEGELKGTKYGVSAMSYPDLDIENLTLEQAEKIYTRDYWDKLSANQLPDGVDVFLFDYAVNSGVARSAISLQRMVGAADDGHIGPQTLKLVEERYPSADKSKTLNLLDQLYVNREYFYKQLSTFDIYGKGWLRRNDDIYNSSSNLLKFGVMRP